MVGEGRGGGTPLFGLDGDVQLKDGMVFSLNVPNTENN